MTMQPAATPHQPTPLWRRRLVLLAFAMGGVWYAEPAPAEQPKSAPPFLVVVHAKNPLASVSREFLARAFLKQVTDWQDGERLRPVDLQATSSVRERFSNDVLKRSVAAVRIYWQQKIFSGRGLPPPELDSEKAVLEYVSQHRGGVGYIGGTVPAEGVKILEVR